MEEWVGCPVDLLEYYQSSIVKPPQVKKNKTKGEWELISHLPHTLELIPYFFLFLTIPIDWSFTQPSKPYTRSLAFSMSNIDFGIVMSWWT